MGVGGEEEGLRGSEGQVCGWGAGKGGMSGKKVIMI